MFRYVLFCRVYDHTHKLWGPQYTQESVIYDSPVKIWTNEHLYDAVDHAAGVLKIRKSHVQLTGLTQLVQS